MTGVSRYSKWIDGDDGNHHLPAKFDVTDGYVGISRGPALTDLVAHAVSCEYVD